MKIANMWVIGVFALAASGCAGTQKSSAGSSAGKSKTQTRSIASDDYADLRKMAKACDKIANGEDSADYQECKELALNCYIRAELFEMCRKSQGNSIGDFTHCLRSSCDQRR